MLISAMLLIVLFLFNQVTGHISSLVHHLKLVLDGYGSPLLYLDKIIVPCIMCIFVSF